MECGIMALICFKLLLGLHSQKLIIFMANFHSEFYPNLMEYAENTGKIQFTLLCNYDSHFTDCHETQYTLSKLYAGPPHGMSPK
jgi:hypothetical protein